MKIIWGFILGLFVFLGLFAVGVPQVLEQWLAPRIESWNPIKGGRDLDRRLKAVEGQIKNLQTELAKDPGALPRDARMGQVISEVNRLRTGFQELEGKLSTQVGRLEKEGKKLTQELEGSVFSRNALNLRLECMKVQMEILARNIGRARNNLGVLEEMLGRLEKIAPESAGGSIKEIKGLMALAREALKEETIGGAEKALGSLELVWRMLSRLGV
jgi:chromosome segregation ATPase